jgi:hypothetical protein
MVTAARGDADGRQAALAAECRTDLGAMRRVVDSLRSTMAGVDPLSRHQHLELPVEERRTCTLLAPLYAKGYR